MYTNSYTQGYSLIGNCKVTALIAIDTTENAKAIALLVTIITQIGHTCYRNSDLRCNTRRKKLDTIL